MVPTVIGHSNALGAGSRHVEVAWSWLKELTSPAGNEAGVQTEGTFVSRISVVKQQWLPGAEWAGSREAVITMMKTARPLPRSPMMTDVMGTVNKGLGPLWAGKVAARDACASIETRVNAILAKGSA
ncbi:MAG: hypothetical protein M1118_12640 [Chloroflexi bacterium]|nr:hypothetical protein [Chloroflexota bacterium]